jgi:hypothetical protein
LQASDKNKEEGLSLKGMNTDEWALVVSIIALLVSIASSYDKIWSFLCLIFRAIRQFGQWLYYKLRYMLWYKPKQIWKRKVLKKPVVTIDDLILYEEGKLDPSSPLYEEAKKQFEELKPKLARIGNTGQDIIRQAFRDEDGEWLNRKYRERKERE